MGILVAQMITRILIVFSSCAFCFLTRAQTLEEYYASAKEAYGNKDYGSFYSLINKAHELHPYHQVILYQKGIAAALTNHNEESIKSLREAILINANFELTIPDLLMLSGLEEFSALKELQKKLLEPVIHSDTAVTIKDRSLHLESIAAGEKRGVLYGASIHHRKVVRIEKDGATSDFVPSTSNVAAVMNAKVNKKSKELWVCASPLEEMKDFDSSAYSGVYRYDLRNGKLVNEYRIDSIQSSVLGDLLISEKGDVYVSDSKSNSILIANRETGKLDVFYANEAFWNMQGICLSDDEKYMFVADYIKGIFRLDMATMELAYLERKVLASLKGIDGLSFYKGTLIAIQNGVSPMRVTQYILNSDYSAIVEYKIIDWAHPAFNEPTNGCIIGDTFYYVANSQWSGYDENHKPLPSDKLQDIVILKCNLK
jgi:sugar lactone lactonase YvrE